jgi:hypothetical protein
LLPALVVMLPSLLLHHFPSLPLDSLPLPWTAFFRALDSIQSVVLALKDEDCKIHHLLLTLAEDLNTCLSRGLCGRGMLSFGLLRTPRLALILEPNLHGPGRHV